MNLFILRWNPEISSYKMADHIDLKSHVDKGELPQGFNWSIREGETLKKNDLFILLQVGTDNDGIAMIGKFRDKCYKGESWKKDGNTVDYADLWIMEIFDCNSKNLLPAAKFEKLFPNIQWHGGHSGVPVEPELASRIFDEIEKEMINLGIWDKNTVDTFLDYDFEMEADHRPTDDDLEDGTILLAFKHEFLEDCHDEQKFVNLICCIKDSQLYVPVRLVKDASNKPVTKKDENGTRYEIKPVAIKSDSGASAYPVFSNLEQTCGEYPEGDFMVVPFPFEKVLEYYRGFEKEPLIVLDPFTEQLSIDKELAELISQISFKD